MTTTSSGPPSSADTLPFGRPLRAFLHQAHERDDSGAALVEFALILPVFALMLFAMIQFGLVFAGWSQLRNSVQTAARSVAMGDPVPDNAGCADLLPPTNNGAVSSYTERLICQVEGTIGTPVGTAGTPEVALYLPGDGTVKVCVQIPAQTFTGFFPNITLSADSQLYLEAGQNGQGGTGGQDAQQVTGGTGGQGAQQDGPQLHDYNPYAPPLPGCGPQTS